MPSTRSTSPPKSAWPGVSTMLMRVPFHVTAVHLLRIVMPRSRSRSFESIARSATTSPVRNVPACLSRPSTSVVLPWSTCAMIATLRMLALATTSQRSLHEHALAGREHADFGRLAPARTEQRREHEISRAGSSRERGGSLTISTADLGVQAPDGLACGVGDGRVVAGDADRATSATP